MPHAVRERVLVANLNVFTASDVDPRTHDVRSWAWGGAETLAALERDAARQLRDVDDGPAIASAYVGGKRALPGGAVRALPWLVREAIASKRVLFGVPPPGRDRILWLALVVTATLTRTPRLFYSETWLHPTGRATLPHRALDRLLAALATTILVPGRAQAAHYERLGRGAKVRRIASPYGLPRTRPTAPIAVRTVAPPELLFVGRLMPLKGFDRLLDLVAALDAERTVRLVALLGDPGTQVGADAAYAASCLARVRTRDAGLTELHLEPVDVAPFYARATLLVAPNRILPASKVPGESWGRTVPEALVAGLPVVATDAVPSAVEHVVEGCNGTVVGWHDDAALARAVRSWLP